MKAAIYARVSSQRQENEHTIESQLAELREAVEHSGAVDWLEFTDEGYSRDDLARPDLDRMRDLAAAGDIGRIYVQSPDRLASGAKLVLLVDELSELGASITFIKGDVTDTPEGKLLLHMQGAIGEYERTKISERTRRGKLYWARQGYLPVRIQPFGYRYVARNESGRARLEADEETAPVLASIFRWFTEEGMTLRGIAARLQEQRVATARGSAHWYASVVRQMLSNSAYRGELLFQTTERIKGTGHKKTRTRKRNRSEWISIPVPRIVSDETWNLAQERLRQNREFATRNGKREYLLRRLLFCSGCGIRLVGQARRDRRIYRCNNADRIVGSRDCKGFSVDAGRIEQAVWEVVAKALKDPEVLASQYQQQIGDAQPAGGFELEKRQLQLAIKRITVQEDRMTDAYRNEAIGLDRFKSEMVGLRDRRESARTQLDDLEKRLAISESQAMALERIEEFCKKVSTGLDSLQPPERQELLRILVERITVEDGKVRVEAVIPTGDEDGGILCTRVPELDSESLG